MSLQIIIALITSPYDVHLHSTYIRCLSQRERYMEVLLYSTPGYSSNTNVNALWTQI
jgi:hypothetical protein